jgi:hypothetical protein
LIFESAKQRVVKSSQVITLPKAKSKTRSKQNKVCTHFFMQAHYTTIKSSFFLLPICKEIKQAHCAWALMARKLFSSAPLSGAAPFLRTRRLG